MLFTRKGSKRRKRGNDHRLRRNICSCPFRADADSQHIDRATAGESCWTALFTVCWRFNQLDDNLCAVVTIHASDDSHPRFGRLGGGHLLSPTSGGIQANGRGEVRNVFGSIGNYCNWSLEDCGGPEHQVAVIRAGVNNHKSGTFVEPESTFPHLDGAGHKQTCEVVSSFSF